MASDGQGISPDEAFRLLGDEMRLAILRAVWVSPEEAVPFSRIRDRIGGPDSGKFNYHLNELAGHFLSRGEDGYRLTQAGREVVRAVVAGAITQRPELERASIDAHCVECDGGLVVQYDEYGHVECGECGRSVMWNEFPPAGLLDRTPGAVADAFDRWTRARFGLAMDGICPNCAREMTTELRNPEVGTDEVGDDDGDGDGVRDITTLHRCDHCRYEARVPLVGHVLAHPGVIAFYDGAGVDVTDMAYWKQEALAREFTWEILAEDPWRVRITLQSVGRECQVTLDERLDVVAVDRPDR